MPVRLKSLGLSVRSLIVLVAIVALGLEVTRLWKSSRYYQERANWYELAAGPFLQVVRGNEAEEMRCRNVARALRQGQLPDELKSWYPRGISEKNALLEAEAFDEKAAEAHAI